MKIRKVFETMSVAKEFANKVGVEVEEVMLPGYMHVDLIYVVEYEKEEGKIK